MAARLCRAAALCATRGCAAFPDIKRFKLLRPDVTRFKLLRRMAIGHSRLSPETPRSAGSHVALSPSSALSTSASCPTSYLRARIGDAECARSYARRVLDRQFVYFAFSCESHTHRLCHPSSNMRGSYQKGVIGRSDVEQVCHLYPFNQGVACGIRRR